MKGYATSQQIDPYYEAFSPFVDGYASFLQKVTILRLALFTFCVIFALAPHSVYAQSALPKPTEAIHATGIHLVEEQAEADGVDLGVGVIIDLSARPVFRFEVMGEPNRIIIDLESTLFLLPNQNPSQGYGAAKSMRFVANYRAGLFMAGQSRIVIDLARPAKVERADFVRQNGVERLVFLLRPVSAEIFATQLEADTKKRAQMRAKLLPAGGSSSPHRAIPLASSPSAQNRPVIVLDAGHGGIDSGATGSKGEMEKDIALAFAKAMKTRLEASGSVDVALTREDDRFIPLAERVAFARERGASLFISLHADSLSGEADVRGASVYTLSERASDSAAARAAEKENRADQLAGLEAQENNPEGVDTILFDLARRETRMFSHLLAQDTLTALKKVAQLHKTPQRAAGFHVLKAGDIPSILIELGYLSNAKDLAYLTDKSAQIRAAEALADAIIRFVNAGKTAP